MRLYSGALLMLALCCLALPTGLQSKTTATSPESAPLSRQLLQNASLAFYQADTTEMSVGEVMQQQFQPLADFKLSAGYSSAAYWLRLSIDSQAVDLAEPERMWLGFANPLLQNILCFQRVSAAAPFQFQLSGETGTLVPHNRRPLVSTSFYVPIMVLPHQQQQYFCRISSFTSVTVPLLLLSEKEVNKRLQQQHLWLGFVCGLLIVFIALNSFVALVTRQSANGIYALVLTSVLLLFFAISGVGPTYLWPGFVRELSWVVPGSLLLLSFSSYWFCQRFFAGQLLPPLLYQGLPFLALLTVVLAVVFIWLPYGLATQLAMYNALLMVVVLLAVGLYGYLTKLDGAVVFLCGRLLVSTGGVIQFAKTAGMIPAYEFIEHILFLAAIAEGLLLSVALAMKNQRLEQEKQLVSQQILIGSEQSLQMQRVLNERLTTEIAERKQTERVQKVLFQISELSVNTLQLSTFLQQIHQAVSTLMFANNFYVALYDRQRDAVQFPYMVDEVDDDLPAADQFIPAARLEGSWTMWILQHGQPLFGDAEHITNLTGLAPRFGAVAKCWLGLPLFGSGLHSRPSGSAAEAEAFGVLCLQIYDERPAYTQEEYRLLDYVSRHISQALLRRQYRADLELTVEQRTADYRASLMQLAELNQQLRAADQHSQYQFKQIKNLLDNTGQGFLSCNEDLQIQPEYSRECCNIFQQQHLAGDLAQLLSAGDPSIEQLFRDVISEVLHSDLPADMTKVYLSLLPQERQYCRRYYAIEYKKIDGSTLLVVLSNITETRALQQALQQQQAEASFVVYSLTREAEVRQTLLAFQTFLQEQRRLSEWDALSESKLFRDLHTFKGLLAQIQAPHLPAQIHQAEEQLLGLKQSGLLAVQSQRLASLSVLEHTWQQLRDLLQQHLGEQFLLGEKQIKINETLLERVCRALADTQPELVLQLRQSKFKSLDDLLAGHVAAAQRLAVQQHKELRVVVDLHPTLWLDHQCYQEFVAALIHLFRNAVDHGCELPHERLAAGKATVATLVVRSRILDTEMSITSNQYQLSAKDNVSKQLLCLTIEEDGQGIAPELLRQQLLQQHLMSADQLAACTDKELLPYIFTDHFSTREQVTEISGRGVGLAAVRQVIEQHGGTISVSSEVGIGSCFSIKLPLQPQSYVIANEHTAGAEQSPLVVPH